MRLCGVWVIIMGLVPVVWNILRSSPVDRNEALITAVHIIFGLTAVGWGVTLLAYARKREIRMARWRYVHTLVALLVNAGILVLLATSGPATSAVAVAAFPILVGFCLALPFAISPRPDWRPPGDVASQRRTLRRLAVGYGAIAAFMAVMALVVGLLGAFPTTGFMLPMVAIFLTLALFNHGESQNPQPWTGPSPAEQPARES